MMRMDCHMHSTVSDGSFTISQLIERAKQNGLDAIVLTDHDTLSQRNQIPETEGLQVFAGIEIFGCICWVTEFNDQREQNRSYIRH